MTGDDAVEGTQRAAALDVVGRVAKRTDPIVALLTLLPPAPRLRLFMTPGRRSSSTTYGPAAGPATERAAPNVA